MFTLGSDAEVPLVDNTGRYRSAIGLIGGSKTHPRKTEHGYVQEDNVLAEFNVNPARTEAEFIENTLLILSDLHQIIKPLDLGINIKASALFEPDQLNHELAMLAGCDPDYNAWELCENNPPSLDGTNLRSCGGHLHIGFDRAKGDMMARPHLVRILDLVAGVPSIIIDKDKDRRKLYGKAGAHRPKMLEMGDPYDGVEYRTLSNFWLTSKDTIGWAFRAVDRAVRNFDELLEITEQFGTTIVQTINNADERMAEKLIEKFNLEVVNA
ncbi:MAG: hypothetical protein H6961_07335 [Chromatiaceae bacterium]|nr:hypothetical protein [Chromatiaceae bacterium]